MDRRVILIVEDIPTIQRLICRTVQRILPSARILTAIDGEEGFLRACINHPDLIITGLSMPRMNGYEMIRLLRREKTGMRTPIIGLSGNDPYCSLTGAFRAQCDEFLAKPYEPAALEAKITRVLSLTSAVGSSDRWVAQMVR